MRRVVPGFEHRPGIHCGSTALADALRTVGVELGEDLVLGLGAGPSFLYFEGLHPSRYFLGRSATFEQDLCRNLGVSFDERPIPGFGSAWAHIVSDLDAGRVVLALTDLRFLPYYATRTHFNGHRVVIAGRDDEAGTALLADTHFDELQEIALSDLARAMESDFPPIPSTDVVFGTLSPPREPIDLRAAGRRAMERAAESMLGAEGMQGLAGIEAFAEALPAWEGAEDWRRCARFAFQVIEKRGCGGGLFRRMYARFLAELGERIDERSIASLSALATDAADAWTTLAVAFEAAQAEDAPGFSRAATVAREVVSAERALWEGCARCVSRWAAS